MRALSGSGTLERVDGEAQSHRGGEGERGGRTRVRAFEVKLAVLLSRPSIPRLSQSLTVLELQNEFSFSGYGRKQV